MASIGKLCINVADARHYGGYFPYLNWWKNGDETTIVQSGSSYLLSNPPGKSLSAWDSLVDANGDLLNPIPVGVTSMTRYFYTTPDRYSTSTNGPPAGWNVAGVSMILEFTGTASTVSFVGATAGTRVGNRIPFTIDSNDGAAYVTFSSMGTNDPPRDIKIFELAYETNIDAGEHFYPEVMADWKRTTGLIRFMQAQRGSIEHTALTFADLPSAAYHSWTYPTSITGIKGGIPTELIVNIVNQIQSHPWVCVPLGFFVEKIAHIETITSANPAVVTAYGHNLVNGDVVTCYQNSSPGWNTTLDETTRTISNVSGNTYQIGLDGSAIAAYDTNYTPYMSTEIDLAKATTELTAFFEYFRDNVDPMLVCVFELSNENFNPTPVPYGFCRAHAAWRYTDASKFMQLAGYLSAHMARVCRDVFGADTHRWRCVVATNVTTAASTTAAITGIEEYITEQALTLDPNELIQVVATNGYYYGPHEPANEATLIGWMDTSDSRFALGQEATTYSYYDRTVNEERLDERLLGTSISIDELPSRWGPHKTIADSYGMELWQYEGDNHDQNMVTAGLWGALSTAEKLRLFEYYRVSVHSDLAAANLTAMCEAFETLGGRYPSKFLDSGAVSPSGPWAGWQFVGDSNAVVEAMAAYNNDDTLRTRVLRTVTA